MIIMAFTVLERWSPELALSNAFTDMKESGIEGLKKHLTSNALKNLEMIESIAKSRELSMLTSAFLGSNTVNTFLEKFSECEWSLRDMMKGPETSKAIIGFDYQDRMVGTIEMTLIREEKVWKIDRLAIPKFEKFTLAKEKAGQPAE